MFVLLSNGEPKYKWEELTEHMFCIQRIPATDSPDRIVPKSGKTTANREANTSLVGPMVSLKQLHMGRVTGWPLQLEEDISEYVGGAGRLIERFKSVFWM